MSARQPRLVWRLVFGGLLSLVLVVSASLGAVEAHPSTGDRVTGQPKPAKLSGSGVAPMKGALDLSKAPTITPGALTSATPIHSHLDRMTPQERATYEANARKGIGVPQAKATAKPPSATASINPSFVGGGTIPLVTKNVDGLKSNQAGGFLPPDQAIATDLGYVMEGVNNAVAIYSASSGALAYGPYSATTFFNPVKPGTDTFSDPQMYYDVMRDRWIVVWLQHTAAGLTYLDIAVSTSNSPTQPTPGAQYKEYQISTAVMGQTSWCDNETLGVEYYSLTITCSMFDTTNTFLGNAIFAFNKAPMLSGGSTNYWWMTNYATPTSSPAAAFVPRFGSVRRLRRVCKTPSLSSLPIPAIPERTRI